MDMDLGRQIDRYVVRAYIGEGGQGRVYRVRHTQLGSDHALKVVTGASAQVRQRLLQEGRAQARLRHPHIVTVTDVIEVDGDPGLIMDLVDGPPLSALLGRGLLTIAQIDLLARGILEGVAHAHSLRFIHRDLKPDNILCAVGPSGLVPKITDFGLVKALGEQDGLGGVRETRSGVMMGTAHYMSPEQIRSAKHVDERTDLWALGVVLYEMVTGTLPFGGGDLLDIFTAIGGGGYRPVSSVRPDAPARMVRAIDAALVIDPNARVATVAELAALFFDAQQPPRGDPGAEVWADRLLRRSTDDDSTDDGGTWTPLPVADTLVADGTPETLLPPEVPKRRPARRGLALAGALLAGVGLAAVWGLTRSASAPEPVEVRAVTAEPVVVPATPAPSEAAEQHTTPPQPSTAEPVPAPAPSARPRPAPQPVVAPAPDPAPDPALEPAPEPAPEPVVEPSVGTFLADGALDRDDRVYLAPSDGGRYVYPGAQVPPGTYTLVLVVAGQAVAQGGPVTVSGDEGLRVTCVSASRDCRVW